MWMLFGLFGAMLAGAAADVMMSAQDQDETDDTDTDDHSDGEEDLSFRSTGNLLSEAAFAAFDETDRFGQFDHLDERIHSSDDDAPAPLPGDVDDLDPVPPVQPPPVEGQGQFDHLDERIHSSDLYPVPEPTAPTPLVGTNGNDLLRGMDGQNDTLSGGAGNDTLLGAGGDNLLIAGTGDNTLVGGEGNDTLLGGAGNDTLHGGWGDDLLMAGPGSNTLHGGAGNDTLIGAALDEDARDTGGRNFLNGGDGSDLLIAGQGDYLNGGGDSDIFALGDWLRGGDPVTIVDYLAEDDQIVLHYDPAQLPDPHLNVTFSPDDPSMAQIWLQGHVIAHVVNAPGLNVQDIVLVQGHPDILNDDVV